MVYGQHSSEMSLTRASNLEFINFWEKRLIPSNLINPLMRIRVFKKSVIHVTDKEKNMEDSIRIFFIAAASSVIACIITQPFDSARVIEVYLDPSTKCSIRKIHSIDFSRNHQKTWGKRSLQRVHPKSTKESVHGGFDLVIV